MKLELGSCGFLSLLTLIFIVAKLWGKVDWSWWIVTLPLWGGFILALFIAFSLIFVFVLAGCTKIIVEEYKKKKK